jgi:hypothetical protein
MSRDLMKSEIDPKAARPPSALYRMNGFVRPLERYTALLGEKCFSCRAIAVRKSRCSPTPIRPFASTKSDAYRALFDVGDSNIAVYVGKGP